MASLSLFELFGLSFARTGKNGVTWLHVPEEKNMFNCRESPSGRQSRQALLGKDTHSGHWAKLACSGVAGTTLLITVNCQDRVMSSGHGFKLYRSQLAQSLHQAKSCKKECWRFANNAFFGFLKMNYYIVPMASLSLLELFGLSFARTGKNGDLIACASRKNCCSNCCESPQCRHKPMASRQALLGKDIRSGHSVKLACSGVACTISNTKLKSGGHGFKLHRSRRCWLNHCIRQKAARKNVDGLPTMPSLVFE